MRDRSIGVISLIGAQQADFIRAKLSDAVGEEVMQRHAILCGDSATFQGTERDIVSYEIEFEQADGNRRKALIESINKGPFRTPIARVGADGAPNLADLDLSTVA